MPLALKAITGIHIASSVFWVSTVLVYVFLFRPAWLKYQSYAFFANFRIELIQDLLNGLNIALLIAALSGIALVVIQKKNILSGTYGFAFTVKMIFLILSFYLIQPFLKIIQARQFSKQIRQNEEVPGEKTFTPRAIAVLVCGVFLIILSSFMRE